MTPWFRRRPEAVAEPDRLFVLQAFPPRILSMRTDGTDVRTFLRRCGGTPDGLAVDQARRQLYWSNMGRAFGRPDGFIERIDLDGGGRTMIVPAGQTFTPKQIQFEPETRRLYWADREGMRIMRCDHDGGNVTVLVQTGLGATDRRDARRHCVGIALDVRNGQLYWTQKGGADSGTGRILRAPIALPDGADPADRPDIEILLDRLPEPIDLLIDHRRDTLYWTDRGRKPAGNSLNAARIGPAGCRDHRILLRGLKEGIGLCADASGGRLFVTDLVGGHVRRLDLASGEVRTIRMGWPLTGIVLVPAAGEVPGSA